MDVEKPKPRSLLAVQSVEMMWKTVQRFRILGLWVGDLLLKWPTSIVVKYFLLYLSVRGSNVSYGENTC